MLVKEIVQQNIPFFNHLTEEQQHLLFDTAQLKQVKRGDDLFQMPKEKNLPFYIAKGVVRTVMEDRSFREITFFRLYEQELSIFCITSVPESISFDIRFVAEEDCTLLTFDPTNLKTLMAENVAVRCHIYETLADRFAVSLNSMYRLIFTKYEIRLASFLWEKYLLTGETEISVTQDELAKLTNTVREVAGRAIRRFSDDGLIDTERGKIILCDLEQLKKLATE